MRFPCWTNDQNFPEPDIENQIQEEPGHDNDRYQDFLQCLTRWLPCICGSTEITITAILGLVLGEDRAATISRILHNLFSCCYNGARNAVALEQADENAEDLEDEIGDHDDIVEIAHNIDELQVVAIEGTRAFLDRFLNHFLSRYTPLNDDTRIAILTLTGTIATDLETLIRYGIINPIAGFSARVIDGYNLASIILFPPNDEDENPPENLEENNGGYLTTRFARLFFAAPDENYEEEEEENYDDMPPLEWVGDVNNTIVGQNNDIKIDGNVPHIELTTTGNNPSSLSDI